MEFEWDRRKAAQNIAKHGVPFEYAARVFLDPSRVDGEDRRRDYVEKKSVYMALGISEYWIIDRFRRTLTVVRNLGSEVEEEVITEKGHYKLALLPGFSLPLKKMLAIADAWSRSQEE